MSLEYPRQVVLLRRRVPLDYGSGRATPKEAHRALVWLSQVAALDFGAVALSPPVLEHYAIGRLVKREVVDYGLDWPLPPPPLPRTRSAEAG